MAKDILDFILQLQMMKARMDFVSKRTVAVGWVDGNKKHPPAKGKKASGREPSLAMIARTLNYGTAPQFKPDGSIQHSIPPRPFMEVLRSEFGDYLNKMVRNELGKVAHGKQSTADFFHNVGVRTKGALQRAMQRSDKYAPNAPSTIKRKGSSRPLIDTGTLIRSVDFEIRMNK